MDDKEEMVSEMFTTLMDCPGEWSYHVLADDAMLDWFGRSIRGRSSILSFVRLNVPRTCHTVESAVKIPAIEHRLLKRFEGAVTRSSSKPVVECGQGDCKGMSTPENAYRPDPQELLKAPHKKRYQSTHDTEQWQFLELKGKLELVKTLSDGSTFRTEKNLQRIILGFTDQIHLIVYEGKGLSRKKLFPPLNGVDEQS